MKTDMAQPQLPPRFPLFESAESHDVFKATKGWLISAPTATGKSHIGLEVIKRNLASKPSMDVFLYLVPFKELAEEVHSRLRQDLPSKCRLHIKTGDYDRPFNLRETDVLVATYESVDGIVQSSAKFQPSVIVADEFSIISDRTRGARIESLIAYLTKVWDGTVPYVMSAVLDNPQRISTWLGADLLKGTEKDRPTKLNVEHQLFSSGKDEVVEKLLKDNLSAGNFLIFCYTKRSTEKLARRISDIVARNMSMDELKRAGALAEELRLEFPYLKSELPELISKGVTYHHSNLEVDLRNRISQAFRNRILKVAVATTTLAVGVNLPARFVVVRDIERGRFGLIPVSEMVNMLGRAGRPGLDRQGNGIFLVDRERAKRTEYQDYIKKVEGSKVEALESQISKSTTNVLHFILSSAARLKGIDRTRLVDMYNCTLAGFEGALESPLASPKELATQVERLIKPPAKVVKIDGRTVRVNGGAIHANGGSKGYEITLSESSSHCECAAYRYQGIRPCKHIEQLLYECAVCELGVKHPDARTIALAAFKGDGIRNNPAYMLSAGLDQLMDWEFLAEKEGMMYITEDGRQALMNYLLEMDHVRLLRDRMRKAKPTENEEEIIRWAIDDYRLPNNRNGEEADGESDLLPVLEEALWKFIQGQSYKLILPQEAVRKFLDSRDRFDQVFNSYSAFCPKDEEGFARTIRIARRRVHYGSPKGLLPLLTCEIDAVDGADKAAALYSAGIKDVKSMASAQPTRLSSLLDISLGDATRAVETAQSVVSLLSAYSGDITELGSLATKTGIDVDDLFDYFVPGPVKRK